MGAPKSTHAHPLAWGKEKKLPPWNSLLAHLIECQKFISLPLFLTIFRVGQWQGLGVQLQVLLMRYGKEITWPSSPHCTLPISVFQTQSRVISFNHCWMFSFFGILNHWILVGYMYPLGWWFSKSENQFPPVIFPDNFSSDRKIGNIYIFFCSLNFTYFAIFSKGLSSFQ